jgi:hypothetical protein
MERSDLRGADGCRRRGKFLVPALVACALSYPLASPRRTAAAAGAIAAATVAGSQRQVLRSFQAPPYTYELALESCAAPMRLAPPEARASACTFAVTLLDGTKVLDRATLAQPGCGPARPTTVSLTLGADRDAIAWNTSDDNCDIDIAARTVKLGPSTSVLLVTELIGSEYRYRSHTMYAARGGKLEEVWNFHDDFSGAHWTRTAVVAGAAGVEDVAFVDLERSMNAVTTKVTAVRLRLDPASGRVARSPLPDPAAPLFLLQSGDFKRAEDVNRSRPDCLRELVVMRARLFPALKLPAYFLGALFSRRDQAEVVRTDIASCSGATPITIIEIVASKGRTHTEHH